MNSKRKCASCGKYFEVATVVGFNAALREYGGQKVSAFCSRKCVIDKAKKARAVIKASKGFALSGEVMSAKKRRKSRFIKSVMSPQAYPLPLKTERKLTENAARMLCHQLDLGKPCISCGKAQSPGEAFHAGHYRSVGSHPEMACDMTNIHLQCAECNTAKSGNIEGYREGLAERYGTKYAEWIDLVEPPNGVLKSDWYRSTRKLMVEDIKRLKKGEPAEIDWREGPPQ